MSDQAPTLSPDEVRLAKLIENISTMTVEKMMTLFIQAREAAAAATRRYDAEQAKLKRIREACENAMLGQADKAGTTGFKVDGLGTAYQGEDKKITLADAAAFTAFLDKLPSDGDRYGFYEQRVSSRRVDEYMKAHDGTLPPGLNIFRQRVMRVRKAADKGDK